MEYLEQDFNQQLAISHEPEDRKYARTPLFQHY
jgi:hypothetical protein